MSKGVDVKRRSMALVVICVLCLGGALVVLWGLPPAEKEPEPGGEAALRPVPPGASGEIAEPAEAAATVAKVPARPQKRLLWEIKTRGGKDCFLELTPAKGKLLAMRKGVLYALDAATGELAWRFPREGKAASFTDPQYGSSYPFVLGVLGDEVVTRLPEVRGKYELGVLAIRLEDGEVSRELRPELSLPHARAIWKRLTGTRVVFWATDKQWMKTQVVVADLAEWREIARFELPKIVGDLQAFKGRVYGLLKRGSETFCRAFTVDLNRGELYSVPIRTAKSYQPRLTILPDGAFLVAEGRISRTCGFEGPWAGGSYVVEEAVYGSDIGSFYRSDPRDGSALWRHPLVRLHSGWRKVSGTANVVALAEHGRVHVLDARTGKLNAAIKVRDVVERDDGSERTMFLACDDERVYVADPTGLRVYSTRPVDPGAPDAEDVGDPACYVARCRKELAEGEFERALKEVSGIGAATRIRPSMREEVAALFSQLDRSPAATFYPELWQDVMLYDGWVAGELFLDEYRRLGAAASLLAIGTPSALRAASEIVDRKDADQYSVFLAAEAAEILAGERPLEKHFVHPRRHADVALWKPVDDETFERLLPELRKWRSKFRYSANLSLKQFLELFGEDAGLAKVGRLQAEAQARGEGEKVPIAITRPPVRAESAPEDEF